LLLSHVSSPDTVVPLEPDEDVPPPELDVVAGSELHASQTKDAAKGSAMRKCCRMGISVAIRAGGAHGSIGGKEKRQM
jgi:hypothetical protein